TLQVRAPRQAAAAHQAERERDRGLSLVARRGAAARGAKARDGARRDGGARPAGPSGDRVATSRGTDQTLGDLPSLGDHSSIISASCPRRRTATQRIRALREGAE